MYFPLGYQVSSARSGSIYRRIYFSLLVASVFFLFTLARCLVGLYKLLNLPDKEQWYVSLVTAVIRQVSPGVFLLDGATCSAFTVR